LLVTSGLLEVLGSLSHFKGVTISFEDTRRIHQDRIRGEGYHRTAWAMLARVAEALPDLTHTAAFTFNRPALRGLHPAELLELFGMAGASQVLFQDLAVPGDARDGLARLRYSFDDFLGFVSRLYDPALADSGTVPFLYEMKPRVADYLNRRFSLDIPVVRYGCKAMGTRVRLLADGTVVPCLAVVGWPSTLARYISDAPSLTEKSLEEVLASPMHAGFVDAKLRRDRAPCMHPCDDCGYAYSLCNPCVFGRMTGTPQVVDLCTWVAEAEHG
jgi:hypothetical protein